MRDRRPGDPSSSPGAPWLAPLRGERGMIVLVPLIVIVVVLLTMAFAGKILYDPPPDPYRSPEVPVRRYVASAAPVVDGDRVVAHLAPGDSVWVIVLQNGSATVFADRTGRRPIGVTSALVVPFRVATAAPPTAPEAR